MKHQGCTRSGCDDSKNTSDGWMSLAIAGAAMLAAAACGGCLYTAIPVMAGSTASYHAPTDNQPSQPPQSSAQSPTQSSSDQTNQNKQQNGAPTQGQGGATP